MLFNPTANNAERTTVERQLNFLVIFFTSLRRHYPDQVFGYDLSPLLCGTPVFERTKLLHFCSSNNKNSNF